MYDLIKNIEYKQYYSNPILQQMNTDIRDMRSSDCLFIEADKTTNLYKLTPEQYNKLLKNNITSTYAKQNRDEKLAINAEAKVIAERYMIADRAEAFAKRDAHIILKDHKDNFHRHPKCHLINPAKGEMGIVSYLNRSILKSCLQHASTNGVALGLSLTGSSK